MSGEVIAGLTGSAPDGKLGIVLTAADVRIVLDFDQPPPLVSACEARKLALRCFAALRASH